MLKQRIVFIGLLLVLSIAGQVLLGPCLGGSDNTEMARSETDAETGPESAPGIGPNAFEPVNDIDTRPTDLLRTFFYMLGFVGLIGIGAWLVCRKFSCGPSGGGQVIRVGETVRMGPRKALHLVRVGNKAFLVGSGPDSFSLVADVSGSVAGDGGTTNV